MRTETFLIMSVSILYEVDCIKVEGCPRSADR